eukprot:10957858-Lingulodinium_polyedra.AAC.1
MPDGSGIRTAHCQPPRSASWKGFLNPRPCHGAGDALGRSHRGHMAKWGPRAHLSGAVPC